MCYCLENAKFAHGIARRICDAVKESTSQKEFMPRLYLLSDVLYNSSSVSQAGSSMYRRSFQDLLPDVFDVLGDKIYNKIEAVPAQQKFKDMVQKVLAAWTEWTVFPQLFNRGLEAMIFAKDKPTDDTLPVTDPLGKRMVRWKLSEQNELSQACRMRGLALGGTRRNQVERLGQFETYWYDPDAADPEEDEVMAKANEVREKIVWDCGVSSKCNFDFNFIFFRRTSSGANLCWQYPIPRPLSSSSLSSYLIPQTVVI